MLCVKSVGLNIALDPLMTMNLSGCRAGFVILVGDDPGGWGSQNEQDSRALADLIEIPWLEPATVADARSAMIQAFSLSEELGIPVVVRITRALAMEKPQAKTLDAWRERRNDLSKATTVGPFVRESMRWIVLPINVVESHQRLIQRLDRARACFEVSSLNAMEGNGSRGLITAGFTYQKVMDALPDGLPEGVSILRLGTLYPLPSRLINSFLSQVDSALVVEESLPLVERAVRAIAQSAGLTLPILGRASGHIPRVGELFTADLATALNRFVPGLTLPTGGAQSRPQPSREPLCEGCPYVPTFEALQFAIEQLGGRDKFVVVGDPGCMVRGQLPPYQLMDVKHGLGSSIGMATGMAAALGPSGKHVVALSGDSSFLHSGLNGLVDAARMNAPLVVIILDNGTTALSGGQPHPASPLDARGQSRDPVDLASLAKATGAKTVHVVDLDHAEDIRAPVFEALQAETLTVIIARGRCVREG
jgi:indolepyruvate ferredoxin oxidoreductase alpha subunit